MRRKKRNFLGFWFSLVEKRGSGFEGRSEWCFGGGEGKEQLLVLKGAGRLLSPRTLEVWALINN
jgi:hypothetical protein